MEIEKTNEISKQIVRVKYLEDNPTRAISVWLVSYVYVQWGREIGIRYTNENMMMF